MAFQLRKNNFTDTLELVGADGTVEKTLTFEIHVDVISPEVRRRHIAVVDAEKALKSCDKKDFTAVYALFSTAVRELLELCFGEENTTEIIKFYNSDFIDISVAIVPYIYTVVMPRTTEALIRKRQNFKNLYKNKRKGF